VLGKFLWHFIEHFRGVLHRGHGYHRARARARPTPPLLRHFPFHHSHSFAATCSTSLYHQQPELSQGEALIGRFRHARPPQLRQGGPCPR
jgi:hypothetical protein